jgi:hypothetical protein
MSKPQILHKTLCAPLTEEERQIYKKYTLEWLGGRVSNEKKISTKASSHVWNVIQTACTRSLVATVQKLLNSASDLQNIPLETLSSEIKGCVIVVEDEIKQRDLQKRLLEEKGWEAKHIHVLDTKQPIHLTNQNSLTEMPDCKIVICNLNQRVGWTAPRFNIMIRCLYSNDLLSEEIYSSKLQARINRPEQMSFTVTFFVIVDEMGFLEKLRSQLVPKSKSH